MTRAQPFPVVIKPPRSKKSGPLHIPGAPLPTRGKKRAHGPLFHIMTEAILTILIQRNFKKHPPHHKLFTPDFQGKKAVVIYGQDRSSSLLPASKQRIKEVGYRPTLFLCFVGWLGFFRYYDIPAENDAPRTVFFDQFQIECFVAVKPERA